LKVLHIGKFFPPFNGGVENYMLDAMTALERHGIETTALVHNHTMSFRTIDEIFTFGKVSLKVVRVGRFAQLLYTPISPAFPWYLRRLIKSFKPDVLHLHLPNPSAFWVLGLISARRIPWVLHWHSDVIVLSQKWHIKLLYYLYRLFERFLLKTAKAIVVTSQPYRDSSETLRPWAWKCHVVPLGVDVEKFGSEAGSINSPIEVNYTSGGQAISQSESIANHRLRVLAVGRLTYYKGFRYLIEAAAKTTNIQVNLVGHGQQANYLKKLTTSLGLQDRVTFHDSLNDRELAQQMLLCDCLCLPSIERTEAFGLVLLEAMYFSKATVIGDVPGSGMGWVVDDGVTGIKVNPCDAGALVKAFTRLHEDREELIKMGQRGKEKFHRCFEIDSAVEGLIDVYRQVIHN
jgi:glycosyltransferase involved in cell wall biosynthesis